jgi:hypothetical protein
MSMTQKDDGMNNFKQMVDWAMERGAEGGAEKCLS